MSSELWISYVYWFFEVVYAFKVCRPCVFHTMSSYMNFECKISKFQHFQGRVSSNSKKACQNHSENSSERFFSRNSSYVLTHTRHHADTQKPEKSKFHEIHVSDRIRGGNDFLIESISFFVIMWLLSRWLLSTVIPAAVGDGHTDRARHHLQVGPMKNCWNSKYKKSCNLFGKV